MSMTKMKWGTFVYIDKSKLVFKLKFKKLKKRKFFNAEAKASIRFFYKKPLYQQRSTTQQKN